MNRYFDIARRLAEQSDHHDHKLGAVIVYKNRIIGRGVNQNKTHPKAMGWYRKVHAELCAVLNTKRDDLTGCSVYVCRIRKDGNIGMARPCAACQKMLRSLGVNRICYSTNSNTFAEELVDNYALD